jgi:hypothetical protein
VNEYYAPPDQFILFMLATGEKRSVDVRWRMGHLMSARASMQRTFGKWGGA